MATILSAIEINNEIKGRPHSALKHINAEGRMTGYLNAYQGEADYKGEKHEIIYVEDMAGDKHDAGAALLAEFLKRYKREYVDKGNLVPIMAELREETTYKFLRCAGVWLAKRYGLEFEAEELGDASTEGDARRCVLLRPKLKSTGFGAGSVQTAKGNLAL